MDDEVADGYSFEADESPDKVQEEVPATKIEDQHEKAITEESEKVDRLKEESIGKELPDESVRQSQKTMRTEQVTAMSRGIDQNGDPTRISSMHGRTSNASLVHQKSGTSGVALSGAAGLSEEG